ncbi:MAG TPA: UvrD-helicase domain-containing protein [Bacteroidia bacterium]|nr:UvrD-helicase domain-containing protein [Bacteroidia bacterium]
MSFVVYKSSAGSGKTYALVKEYLKISLQTKSDTRYKNILAITFTNKAAAEMKARVIDALIAISGNSKPEGSSYFLLQDLKNELQLSEALIKLKCEAVLRSMLHNYSDVAISTIDKFVHKVLRTFAFDLQVPFNFMVEMESDLLLQTAIERLLAKVGNDEALTRTLIDFILQKVESERNWRIEQDLLDFSRDLLREQAAGFIKKLKPLNLQDFEKIRSKVYQYRIDFENKLQKIGQQALDILSSNEINHSDLSGGANAGLGKYFLYLSTGTFDKFKPTQTHLKNVDQEKWYSDKATANARHSIELCKAELRNLFFAAQKIIDQELSTYIVFRALYKNSYGISLLNELDKLCEEIKRENGLLHISEFNKKISNIVLNEPVPFIYERIGEKYKNYLIDEFQDTSVLQWQNFIPLLENSLAINEFSMIVGDGKQAIYRWRGGEVEQFSMLPKFFDSNKYPLLQEREAIFSRNFEEKFLTHNRRSKSEIVAFNNHFFAHTMQHSGLPENLKAIYSSLEQKFDEQNTGGLVNFQFVANNDKESDVQLTICNRVVDTIEQVLEDGYELSDITLLCRTNKDGILLAQFLLEKGISVISKESLLVSASAEVNLVIACLVLLHQSNHDIARTVMMHYLLKRTTSDRSDISDYFEEEDLFKNFMKERFPGWNPSSLNQLPLYELCESLLRLFNLNIPADPYLVFFLDAVHQFASKNTATIPDFLNWWENKRQKLSIVIPEGLNAVNIMTVHKSKGLEFPVVIFAFANWMDSKKGETLWVDFQYKQVPELSTALLPMSSLKETEYHHLYEAETSKKELDKLNILYVAFTRAVNRLYVVCEMPGSYKKLANYYVDYLKHVSLWVDSEASYTIGTKQKKVSVDTSSEAITIDYLKGIHNSHWRNRLRLSEATVISDDTPASKDERAYGNLMHAALALMPDSSHLSSAIEQLLLTGMITQEESEGLSVKLSSLLNNALLSPFFVPGLNVKMEAEILLPSTKTYRPDRVVFYPEKVVVLDYKTGVQLEKHKTQLRNYVSILRQMGHSAISSYLIYTESEKLLEVE